MLYWRLRIFSMNLSVLVIPYLRISLQPPARITVSLDWYWPYVCVQFKLSSGIPAPQMDSTSRWKGVDTSFIVFTACSVEVVSRMIVCPCSAVSSMGWDFLHVGQLI